MKDKTTRLLEAIEHPELYDDADLMDILEDHDTAEIYGAINKIEDALTHTTEPDIDEEWKSFTERNHQAFSREGISRSGTGFFGWLLSRKVASAALITIASLSIVAAGIGMSRLAAKKEDRYLTGNDGRNAACIEEAVEAVGDSVFSESDDNKESSMTIYKDETLDNILDDMGRYYDVQVVFKNYELKDLRLFFQWDRTLSLSETISQLNNFQQIDIKINDDSIIVE